MSDDEQGRYEMSSPHSTCRIPQTVIRLQMSSSLWRSPRTIRQCKPHATGYEYPCNEDCTSELIRYPPRVYAWLTIVRGMASFGVMQQVSLNRPLKRPKRRRRRT